jgi:tetratricopeptide (TPR) repeat protein
VRTDDPDLQAALGYAYAKLGRHADANAAFERATVLAPAHPTAHASRGVALEAMGDVQKAREAFEAALKAGSPPAVSASKARLAAIACKEQRWADARTLAEAAVSADPKNPMARYVLGLACFELGDRKAASDQEFALTAMDAERAADLRARLSRE